MHKYIERFVNVESDDSRGFKVVSGLLDKWQEDYKFISRRLIQEMTMHMESYTKL